MEEKIDVKYLPLWSRYLEMFRQAELTKSQAGQLIWMMMEYQFEGREPESVPKALRSTWVFLRKDLDDARKCYEKNVKNGRKAGHKKKGSAEDKPQVNPDITQTTPDTPQMTPEGSISMSTTTSSSTTTSATSSPSKDTGSAPAQDAGVCVEKHSFGEFGWVRLTAQQYDALERSMGTEELQRCITYIDESAQATGNRNRWKDWYLQIRRCHDNRWHEPKYSRTRQEIPKGASGVLGEAELEAIARVLRE